MGHFFVLQNVFLACTRCYCSFFSIACNSVLLPILCCVFFCLLSILPNNIFTSFQFPWPEFSLHFWFHFPGVEPRLMLIFFSCFFHWRCNSPWLLTVQQSFFIQSCPQSSASSSSCPGSTHKLKPSMFSGVVHSICPLLAPTLKVYHSMANLSQLEL